MQSSFVHSAISNGLALAAFDLWPIVVPGAIAAFALILFFRLIRSDTGRSVTARLRVPGLHFTFKSTGRKTKDS